MGWDWGMGGGPPERPEMAIARVAGDGDRPLDPMGTKMCRISVRTTLVFTPKVDIPEFLVLFLKKVFPNRGKLAPMGPWPWPWAWPWPWPRPWAWPWPWGALGGPGGSLGPGPGPWPWPCGLSEATRCFGFFLQGFTRFD